MIDKITQEITNSFLNYLHLYSWFNIQIHKIITSRKFEFVSVEDFWKMIFTEELKPGDIIKIKEGFLTEWIPRLPGQSWKTLASAKDETVSLDSLRNGKLFSTCSLLSHESTSLGVIKLPFGQNSNNFAMLSITSFDSWSVDLSIPIIISKEVYYQFINTRKKNQAVEGDIEAVLEFGELPLFNDEMILAMGADCNKEFIKQYSCPLGIPKVYLRLSSPMNAKFRSHNSHPSGSIWALTKHSQKHKVIHNFDINEIKIVETEPYEFLGFGTAHIDISNLDLIQSYANAFMEGHSIPKDLYPHLKTFDNPSKEITVLTEFDGQKRYFNNSISIANKPWEKTTDKEKIITVLQLLEKRQFI